MKNIIITVFIILESLCSIGQALNDLNTDTLNKRNERGKKDGYWIELVDEKLRAVTCKRNANFFRFVYYDNGYKIDPAHIRFLPFERTSLKVDGNDSEEGKIILMDGNYKIYNKFDELIFEANYIKGKKSGQHISYKKDGSIYELLDYTKTYNNQEHSFLILFDEQEDGSFKSKSYYRKYEGTWGAYDEE